MRVRWKKICLKNNDEEREKRQEIENFRLRKKISFDLVILKNWFFHMT